jgi:hypothetical protein
MFHHLWLTVCLHKWSRSWPKFQSYEQSLTASSTWATDAWNCLMTWSINCQLSLYLASPMMPVDETNPALHCRVLFESFLELLHQTFTTSSQITELLGWANDQLNWQQFISALQGLDDLVLDLSRPSVTENSTVTLIVLPAPTEYRTLARILSWPAADHLCLQL